MCSKLADQHMVNISTVCFYSEPRLLKSQKHKIYMYPLVVKQAESSLKLV